MTPHSFNWQLLTGPGVTEDSLGFSALKIHGAWRREKKSPCGREVCRYQTLVGYTHLVLWLLFYSVSVFYESDTCDIWLIIALVVHKAYQLEIQISKNCIPVLGFSGWKFYMDLQHLSCSVTLWFNMLQQKKLSKWQSPYLLNVNTEVP